MVVRDIFLTQKKKKFLQQKIYDPLLDGVNLPNLKKMYQVTTQISPFKCFNERKVKPNGSKMHLKYKI